MLAVNTQTPSTWSRDTSMLFSSLPKCAECGGGYVMYWRDRLACFGARSRGTCTNRLTISRQEVEERVLVALRDKLMRRDLFEDFCREYVRELNRLRMEHRASLTHGRAELARVEREIRKFIQAVKDGVSALSIKDQLLSLEARKAELQSRLEAPEMPEASCCTRGWPTSIERRSGAFVLRWRARRAAQARERPSAR